MGSRSKRDRLFFKLLKYSVLERVLPPNLDNLCFMSCPECVEKSENCTKLVCSIRVANLAIFDSIISGLH